MARGGFRWSVASAAGRCATAARWRSRTSTSTTASRTTPARRSSGAWRWCRSAGAGRLDRGRDRERARLRGARGRPHPDPALPRPRRRVPRRRHRRAHRARRRSRGAAGRRARLRQDRGARFRVRLDLLELVARPPRMVGRQGYPHGLQGTAIPSSGRIVALADVIRCVDERAPLPAGVGASGCASGDRQTSAAASSTRPLSTPSAPLAAYTRDPVRDPPNRSIRFASTPWVGGMLAVDACGPISFPTVARLRPKGRRSSAIPWSMLAPIGACQPRLAGLQRTMRGPPAGRVPSCSPGRP